MLNKIKSFNAPEIEEKVLDFWDKKNIFKKTLIPKKSSTLRQNKKEKDNKKTDANKEFIFWEGPPYANGRPGIHHILARVFKDVFLRYKTMQGFVVAREAGWDTHGLPIEIATEKALGVSNKKEIEKIGVEKFNEKAKEEVFKYKDDWDKITKRIGYWLDLKNAYMTYTPDFIESLWWVFSEIHKNGYLKEFYKVIPYCHRCQTALSSHELAQPGVYKEVNDPSVFVKFAIKDKKNEYFLVWTTTPWTLSANVALAVSNDVKYKKYKIGKDFIWSSNIPSDFTKLKAKIIEEKNGADLVGIEYNPLYKLKSEIKLPIKQFSVLSADFIDIDEGTGIVHIAPTFGEDDFNLVFGNGISEEYKIPHTITEDGKVVKGLIGEGLFIKVADKIILADLEKRGLLFLNLKEKHEYPHCWRCNSSLIYSAQKAWFFEMSKLRKELIKSNNGVNWIPDYIKNGRFGEWISKARDWSISRRRYWGTPLPIWKCVSCKNVYVAGENGLNDLNKNRFHKNNFFIMRHGEADANVQGWLASEEGKGKKISHLTKKGIKQVELSSKELAKHKIDLIFTSPYERAMDTAEIINSEIGVKVIVRKELAEIKVGKFNGKPIKEYDKEFSNTTYRLDNAPDGGETLKDVMIRVYKLILDIDSKYNNKNILIVSHGDTLWMLKSALGHIPFNRLDNVKYIKTGEFEKINLDNFPTDLYGSIDIHKPYVDNVKLKCDKCEGEMNRVPDVADVWFDSGSMPYARFHFPFSKKSIKNVCGDKKIPKGFPADFISEGVDQTRGWFYTLMAVSVLLKLGTPYKNVISLGLVLDKNGKKMSKSKGNVVEPWSVIAKTGVDAIRWYFYTISSPAEPKNFDVQDIVNTSRKFIMILYNSYSFLNLYGKKGISIKKEPLSKNLLDKWIFARTEQTIKEVSKTMDEYNVMKSCQAIEGLVDDLSRWYIRRSRKRFQMPKNSKELTEASASLAYVLLSISKLIAPFTPFFAEALYQSLKDNYVFKSKESVHLDDWLTYNGHTQNKLIDDMQKIRDIAGDVLSVRADVGIKIRQPLPLLTIKKGIGATLSKEFLNILSEEINVKKISFSGTIKDEFILDTKISVKLKNEGRMRELFRIIQGLRQDARYVPSDMIYLWIKTEDPILSLLNKNIDTFKKNVGAKKIFMDGVDSFDSKIESRIDGTHLVAFVRKKL